MIHPLPSGPIRYAVLGLAAFALAALAATGILISLDAPTGKTAGAVVDIPKGMTAAEIAHLLHDRGLIRSVTLFRIVARSNGYATRFKAGRYRLPREMRTAEVAQFLAETPPGPVDIRVTIPEGLSIREIASILRKTAGIDSAAFSMFASSSAIAETLGVDNATLEGYLYPETYFIAQRSTAMDVIRRMVEQFREEFGDSLKVRARELGMTVNETVTMASLIETEAANDEERSLISSVFHRRLKLGYPLQANPTIQYILGEKRRVLDEDLKIESPFNTYLNKGLPPGPIASPGVASIRAALWPADTKYLYFMADGEGGHVFSKTLSEHNAAVARYMRQRNRK